MKEILKFNRYYKDHKSFKKDFARILYKIFSTFSSDNIILEHENIKNISFLINVFTNSSELFNV